jgi:hypothetical protein
MNRTSFELCLNSFGRNESGWVGKKVSFSIKQFEIHVENKVNYITGMIGEPVKQHAAPSATHTT